MIFNQQGVASGSGGGEHVTWYGTSTTSYSTGTKSVTCAGFTLNVGETIAVTFSNYNTAANLYLNVNGTGTVRVYANGDVASSTNQLCWRGQNTQILFKYDGTYFKAIDLPSFVQGAISAHPKSASLSTTSVDHLDFTMTGVNCASTNYALFRAGTDGVKCMKNGSVRIVAYIGATVSSSGTTVSGRVKVMRGGTAVQNILMSGRPAPNNNKKSDRTVSLYANVQAGDLVSITEVRVSSETSTLDTDWTGLDIMYVGGEPMDSDVVVS